MGVAGHTFTSRHLPPTTHPNTFTMADAEQQVVEEVAPEPVAEKPEEVTAVAAEAASEEASDPPAEAVAAVKISEDAAAAPAEGEAAEASPEAVLVEGKVEAVEPVDAAASGEEPAPAAAEVEEAPA